MKNVKNLLKFTSTTYGKRFTGKLIFIICLAAITSSAQFALTWYLGVIIDSIGDGFQVVSRYFLLISLFALFAVIGNALLIYVTGRMTSLFFLNLRKNLGKKLCNAEFAALERIKDGDLLSITTNDIEGFRPWLFALYSLGHIPIKFLLVFITLFIINWKLALVIIPLLPLAMLPSLFLSKKLHFLYSREKEAHGKTTGFINEVLDFILSLKSFCLESIFQKKNCSLLADVEKARVRRQLREQEIQTFGRCLGHIANFVIFITGSYLILHGEMTVGQIVTIMLLTNFIGEALNLIYAIPTSFQGANASMGRVNQILSLVDVTNRKNNDIAFSEKTDAFEIKNLSFSFDDSIDATKVLCDINFSIEQGMKIAIIGKSGSGKTTLFKLLCGLYSPASGTIGSALPLKSNLSVVTQESFLFPDTIRNNILLAKSDVKVSGSSYKINETELISACKKAQIHDFID